MSDTVAALGFWVFAIFCVWSCHETNESPKVQLRHEDIYEQHGSFGDIGPYSGADPIDAATEGE